MKTATVIDNLRIVLDEPVPFEPDSFGEPFYFNDLVFVPKYNNKDGEIHSYEASLLNLRIRYIISCGKLIIDNSLHKYALGNNYTDFTLPQIRKAISSLSDLLQMDVSKGKVKQLEYGVVITALEAIQPHKTLLSYKGKTYQPMSFKGKEYGSNCIFSDYTIKGYDKTLEVKQHDKQQIEPGMFRWEVAVKNMRCLHNRRPQIPVFTVSDLMQVDTLQYLADDLIDRYKTSLKQAAIDYNSLSIQEMTAIARMEHPKVKAAMKKNHYEACRKNQRTYTKIMRNGSSQLIEIEKQLIEKCQYLIYN